MIKWKLIIRSLQDKVIHTEESYNYSELKAKARAMTKNNDNYPSIKTVDEPKTLSN